MPLLVRYEVWSTREFLNCRDGVRIFMTEWFKTSNHKIMYLEHTHTHNDVKVSVPHHHISFFSLFLNVKGVFHTVNMLPLSLHYYRLLIHFLTNLFNALATSDVGEERTLVFFRLSNICRASRISINVVE